MTTRRLLPVLALLAIAACDDPTPPDAGRLTDPELANLSDAMVGDDFANTTAAAEIGVAPAATSTFSASPRSGTMDFTATWTCPLGGQISVAGTRTREWDFEAGTGSMDLSVTKTHLDCARQLPATTITLNGDVALLAHHEWERHARRGAQTMSLDGELGWVTADGREGTCTIDVDAVYDPATATRTVSGTFCDREISITRSWSW